MLDACKVFPVVQQVYCGRATALAVCLGALEAFGLDVSAATGVALRWLRALAGEVADNATVVAGLEALASAAAA